MLQPASDLQLFCMNSAPPPAPATPSPKGESARWPWGVIALLIGVSMMSALAFTWPLLRFIELDAGTALTLFALGWGPWALLAGCIIVFARVAPLDPDRWHRTLPLHLAGCACLALGGYLLSDQLRGTHFATARFLPDRGVPTPDEFVIDADAPLAAGVITAFDRPAELHSAETSLPPARTFVINSEGGFRGPRFFPRPAADARTLATMMLSRSFGSGLIVPVYVLIVAVTQAMRNHRRAIDTSRLAEKAAHQLVQARLQALQSQLQPHFLFNTLNAVTNYIHAEPQVAEEMLCALSDMLRRVLQLSDRTEIPLREELELIELYLRVQRHRFGGRLELVRHIDERLLDRMVPPLLLQPVVENAILHGVAHATSAHPIELRIEEVNQHLRLSVIDHHPAPAAERVPASHGGVGLTNIRNRLATLYREHASLHAKPRLEGGFLTELNLPLHAPSPAS